MKKLLLFSFFSALLFSCKQSSSPKETAQAFIKAISASDLSTASQLASTETKAVIDKAQKGVQQVFAPEESFEFSSLSETVTGKEAEVKNSIVAVSLVEEKEGWKVVVDEKLLNEIQNRDELLSSAKAKWEALQTAYENRLKIAKQYIEYKKSNGVLSAQAQALNNMIGSFSPEKEWTKEKITIYVQKQQQLKTAIDNALEPSLAANTDLSLNYFLQISNAGDKIRAAEAEYQEAAEKAHSPIYVPLPVGTRSTLKVNSN